MDGSCVHQDDGDGVLETLLQADMVLFVTPIYYFGMSAQLKTMIDRFYARNAALAEKHMKAAVIATAWDDNETVMKAFLLPIWKRCLTIFSLNAAECFFGPGAGTVEMMPQRYRQKAYDMGRRL